jgi:predicted phage terminase large subunit-like protein
MDLALRDSVKCRALIESDWYRATFAPKWTLAADQNAKGSYKNTEEGFRLSLSVGGQGTGFRGNAVTVDDPLNAKDQHSELARKECIFWWDNVMSSRLNDLAVGSKVIIMQRLHEEDLSGHVLATGRYEHLCLPSEFEPERRSVTSIGFKDPRTAAGELLFPQLFPAPVIAEVKETLGSYGWSGQHQQRPSPAAGGIFQRDWWKFYAERPPEFDEVLQSWDCAFKGTDTSDYVVGMVLGRIGADIYLLDIDRGRRTFTETCDAVQRVSQKWPEAALKLVEDKANGTAVLDSLKSKVTGLVAVDPEGGKDSRAHAVSPTVEAGNVYLPRDAGWVEPFIDECAVFPNGANDDQVDAFTQGVLRWIRKKRKLGVVDYLESKAEAMKQKRINDLAKPLTSDKSVRCPKCNSVACVRIQGKWRCNACGHQWAATVSNEFAK